MWFCCRSRFFFMECVIGVLDMFIFTSAQLTSVTSTSERSTPTPWESPNLPTAQTSKYRRTPFEDLKFWSGESFTMSWNAANPDCKKKEKDDQEHKRLKKTLSGRRRLRVSESTTAGDNIESTRLSDTMPRQPEGSSLEETVRNSKINGYTLLQDMTSLMSKFMGTFKGNVTTSVVSKTVEVHDIVICTMSKPKRRHGKLFRAGEDKYVDEKPQKKIILIVHGLSSMGFEHVPCLSRKESFMKLLRMYEKHLDKFDIYLIPMGNPDGIADETLSMWNKNKSPQASCLGVAVDRNFDVKWNKSHGIHSCSQQYPGESPFTEPESRTIADLIHLHNHKIVAYIHVHGASYGPHIHKGDAVLFPKGYSNEPIEDKYADINTDIDEAMKNAGFRVYGITVTSLHKWYGEVSGTSVDYATSVYGIPYAMEFVMQSYEEFMETKTTSEEMHDNVLTEVWSRVIDVVFENIFKSTESSSSESVQAREFI